MKLITFNDINSLNISPVTFYNWANEMILNKKQTSLPPKISIKPSEGVFHNIMPCIITNKGEHSFGGVKVVTRYPERIPSLDGYILLLDAETGDFLALMDSNFITSMRTGAVAAHSIMLFAKKEFSTIGILGLGNVSRATILILASMMPNKKFVIKLLKYKEQEYSFSERFSEYKNLEFIYVDKIEQLVEESDVLISGVTYAPQDFCDDHYFGEGILVLPIHTLGFTNCDLFFDKIYADDYGHVKHFKNFDKFKYFAEVSDVVNNKAFGRQNDKERIMVYNIGLSIHDINFASHIYKIILENTSCIADVDFFKPTDKFYI